MGGTHTLLSPTIIAKEALRLLVNNLVMGSIVYRDYETEFPGMPKTGGSIQIRKPVKFRVTKDRIRSTSTVTEQYITLNVATQAHVSWAFHSVDLTLTIEQYSDRYIRPAAAALANQIDADLCGLYVDVPAEIWESTGHVTPHSFTILGRAMQQLDEEAVPPDERCIVFDPAAHWSMANALSNWNFREGGEDALRKGYLGKVANAQIYMDQNVKVHTVGEWATDSAAKDSADRFGVFPTAVTGANNGLPTGIGVNVTQNQEIMLEGINCSSGTGMGLKAGDIFTLEGVYAVNPMSGESTGSLRQFVVTRGDWKTNRAIPTVSTTLTPAMVNFQPQMLDTGPYKTVSTLPVADCTANIHGVPAEPYPQNLAFHKNAFALCMVPLQVPDGVWSGSASEDGYSIRVVKDYDISEDDEIIRMDVLYGVKTIYPELGVRIKGAQG